MPNTTIEDGKKARRALVAVIRNPEPFLAAFICVVGALWALFYLIYSAALQSKDALIQSQEREVTAVRQAMVAKDDLLSAITNQFITLAKMQTELTNAQTFILEQQTKLENVESLVKGWFKNTIIENIDGNDTNRFILISATNSFCRVGIKLRYPPVPNSIVGLMKEQGGGQTPLLPGIRCVLNIALLNFNGGPDLVTNRAYHFSYIRDTLETNTIMHFAVVSNVFEINADRVMLPDLR